MRNAKGHLPTAELRRELQISVQKFAPAHRTADDSSKGKDVIVGVMKEDKDAGIKDRAWLPSWCCGPRPLLHTDLGVLDFGVAVFDSSGKVILASPSVDSTILELPYVVLPCLVGFLALRIVAPLVADLGGGGLGISPLSTADASRLTWLVQSSSDVEEDALGAPAAAG
jgi:hypothetical protein